MAEVDSLEIKIEASSTDAAKKVNDLAAALEKVKKALSGGGLDKVSEKIQAIGNVSQQIKLSVDPESGKAVDGLTAKVVALRNAVEQVNQTAIKIPNISKMDGTGAVKPGKDANKPVDPLKIASQLERTDKILEKTRQSVANLEKEYAALQKRQGKGSTKTQVETNVALAETSQKLQEQKSLYDQLLQKREELSQLATGGKYRDASETGEVESQTVSDTADKIGILGRLADMARGAAGALSGALSGALTTVSKGAAAASGYIKKLGSGLLDMAKRGVKSAVSGLKNVGSYLLSKFTKPFTSAAKAFDVWKGKIGSVIFYRAIRSAIKAVTDGFKTGIENLYQYSKLVGTEFAPAMNQLATSSLYLKNSLGAMAAPLIQTLAPAIDFIIDKFVALFNIIGKVMAALTGKSTYTQAKKHAVEYTEAAEGASKATEEFQRYLIGIDELNIINDNKDNGGGGGGLGDYEDMFEETPLPDWAEDIKDKIDDDDWQGAGESLADHLNDLLHSWDPYEWGRRLGEMINRALEFAYGFLTRFDFEGLGRKVAQGLNGILDTVDWDLLGRTFAAGFNGFVNFVYGFVTTFHWAKLGAAIGTAINAWFDEVDWVKAAKTLSAGISGVLITIQAFIDTLDWASIGEKISTFLNNINWEGIFKQIAGVVESGLHGILTTVDTILTETDWGEIGKSISDAFTSIDWESLTSHFTESITHLLESAREFITSFDWTEIGKSIGDAVNGIDWEGMISNLIGGLGDILNSALELITGFLEETDWNATAKGIFDGILGGIQEIDWGELISNIFELLGAAGGAIVSGATGLVAALGGAIGDALTGIKEYFSEQVEAAGGDVVAGILTGILNAVADIAGWIVDNIFDPFIEGFKSAFEIGSPSKVMEEQGGYIVEGFLNGISDAWGDIVDFFKEKFDDIKEKASETWENIKTTASQKWNAIKTTVGTVWDNMKSSAKTAFENIKSKVTTATETAKSKLTSAWNTAKTTVTTAWNNLKTSASTTFNNIKTSVSTTTETAKSALTSAWESAKTTVIGIWDDLKSKAETVFSTIKTKVSGAWEAIKESASNIAGNVSSAYDSAVSWGKDFSSGVASGINNGVGTVTSAAKNLAGKVAEYVHFSEPDVGPLANFHEFMPDMLALMAKGIRDNAYLAVNAVGDVAGQLSGAFSNMAYDAPKPRFSNPEDMQVNYKLAYAGGYDQQQSGGTYAEAAGGTNADVVSALFAVATQIVTAINNKEFEANLDGEKIAKRVTTIQEQRNRMYRR